MNALERLGRRRRDRREEQPTAYPPFAVEACECLSDGPFALLRITGTGLRPPVALVSDGDAPEYFEPLPQPDNTPGAAWRAAFAIPAELAEPGTQLWLHDGGEFRAEVVVPAPQLASETPARRPVAVERSVVPDLPEDDAGNDPRARKLVEAWSEVASLREKLSEREQQLAETLKELLEARADVQPLRDRAEELEDELAELREELELAHKQGREARLRATENGAELDALRAEKAAELDAVHAELGSAEPRVIEAERAAEQARQEAVTLREEVERLEQALLVARSDVEAAIREAEETIAATKAEAEAERTRLKSEAAEQQQTTEKLESKLAKFENGNSRRRGFGRRSDDRALAKVRSELEATIAEKQQRIEQLEQEAQGFADRRDDAKADSLRERISALEDEVRQHTSCNEDLRALLESEREQVGSARGEVHDLKRQLATAKAGRTAAAEAAAASVASDQGADDAEPARPAAEPPPWSALDDELLARIEKAKALTG